MCRTCSTQDRPYFCVSLCLQVHDLENNARALWDSRWTYLKTRKKPPKYATSKVPVAGRVTRSSTSLTSSYQEPASTILLMFVVVLCSEMYRSAQRILFVTIDRVEVLCFPIGAVSRMAREAGHT